MTITLRYQNQKKLRTKPKSKTVRLIALGIVLFVLGLAGWFGFNFFKSLNKITADSGQNSFLSVFKNNKMIKGEEEGRTNILLLGNGGANHPGGGLTDTIMVLSIDWKSKKAALISVPRDLWVKVPNYGYTKINAAYFAGNQNPKKTGGGAKVASEVVSEVLGLPLHYYVSLDFDGFKKTVDALGGVDIYVDKALYDPYYPAPNMIDYDPLKITAGLHHMDGNLALKYARSRETTSDFDRSRRQQQVLSAVKEKMTSLETISNPKKLSDLLTILGDHIRTSFSVNEIKSFWDLFKGVDTENVINKVFDTAAGSPLTSLQDERGYIIIPKKGIGVYTDMQEIAKNIFSTQKAEPKNAKIEVLNGTDKKGIATQISQLLKSYGYNVVKTGNATTPVQKTVIYDCKAGTSTATINELIGILNAEKKTKTCTDVDIQIILGQNSP